MSSPRHTKKFAHLSILILVLSLAFSSSILCAAQVRSDQTTTLAIFQDNHSTPISPELFTAVQAALHANLVANDPELQPLLPYSTDIQILRENQIVPGLVVTNSVTIYLHGDCNPLHSPMARLNPGSSGTLGWVERRHGQIEPFIHVDCSHLVQFLQPEMTGKSADQRNQIQAQAIARVLLHEWLHIANQTPHHAKEGIARAQFTRAELVSKPSANAPIFTSIPTPISSDSSAGK